MTRHLVLTHSDHQPDCKNRARTSRNLSKNSPGTKKEKKLYNVGNPSFCLQSMRMALYTEGVTEHNTLSGEIYIVLVSKYRDGES